MKLYNPNEGVRGREGGPYLDKVQFDLTGQGVNLVTAEQLVALHNSRFPGDVVSVSDITAPVYADTEDEVTVSKSTSKKSEKKVDTDKVSDTSEPDLFSQVDNA